MKTISKLDIDLFEGVTELEYKKAKAKWISAYPDRYEDGGFLSLGHYVPQPEKAEADWNEMYPDGFNSWSNNRVKLTSEGEQRVINKINEIIDFITTDKKVIKTNKRIK